MSRPVRSLALFAAVVFGRCKMLLNHEVLANCHGNAGNGQRRAIFHLELGISDHHLPHLLRGRGVLGLYSRLWFGGLSRFEEFSRFGRRGGSRWAILLFRRLTELIPFCFTAKPFVPLRPTCTCIPRRTLKAVRTFVVLVLTKRKF